MWNFHEQIPDGGLSIKPDNSNYDIVYKSDLNPVEKGLSLLHKRENVIYGFQSKMSTEKDLIKAIQSPLEIFTSIRIYQLVNELASDSFSNLLLSVLKMKAHIDLSTLKLDEIKDFLNMNDTIEYLSILIQSSDLKRKISLDLAKRLISHLDYLDNNLESLLKYSQLLSLLIQLDMKEECKSTLNRIENILNLINALKIDFNSYKCMNYVSNVTIGYFLSEQIQIFPGNVQLKIKNLLINILKSNFGNFDSPIEISMRLITAMNLNLLSLSDDNLKSLIISDSEKLIIMQKFDGCWAKDSFYQCGKFYFGSKELSTAFAVKALHLFYSKCSDAGNSMTVKLENDKKFCFKILAEVSMSFCPLILKLNEDLKLGICIFYLILRALDTIEDDTGISIEKRASLLLSFPQTLVHLKGKFPSQIGSSLKLGWRDNNKPEVELLNEFDRVLNVFSTLSSQQKKVISDIVKIQSKGMNMFLTKQISTMEDYDLYCYYVAGSVVQGLTNLFKDSDEKLFENSSEDFEMLGIHLGNYLQKVNIIRDIFEDTTQDAAPRVFYPKDIWGKHFEKIEEILLPENYDKGIDVVNFLIKDAQKHVPFCMKYLKLVESNLKIFRFCAITFLSNHLTLLKCFNNKGMFSKLIKLERNIYNEILLECNSLDYVCKNMKEIK